MITSSLIVDLILVAISIWLLFARWMRKRFEYFSRKGLPNPEPSFLTGNASELFAKKKSLAQLLHKVYMDYKGCPVVGFYQSWVPMYLLRDPELVNKVLLENFSSFYSHGFSTDDKINPMDRNLFMLDGNKWRALRKKLSPTFTSGKLKWMFEIMEGTVDAFTNHLENETDKEIEIRDELCRLTTDIIGSCAFGIDSESIRNPDSQFRRMGKKIFTPSKLARVKATIRFVFPWIHRKLALRTVDSEVSDFMVSVTKQSLDHREATGEKRSDFLQLLLQLRQKGQVEFDRLDNESDQHLVDPDIDRHVLDSTAETKLEINDELLAAQLFVFFVGGFESSATSMSFLVYLMSTHPEIQEKARAEILASKEKYGGFNYESIREMEYLDACIKENLRLFPPFGMNVRKCTKTCELKPGLTITQGDTVVISITAMHRDPDLYDSPDEFKPERFLHGDPPASVYLPFGLGPRTCIAMRFAQMEIKLAMAKLLTKYRIETCPTMRKYEPIAISPTSFVSSPVNGIWVKLKKL